MGNLFSRKHEKEADELKREIRLTLPKGVFMPFSRGDLIELVNRQDKIANTAKDIAGRVFGRELQIPGQISEDFITYLQRCLDAIQQARKAINELDELLETGFKGREVDIVTKMISELEAIEDDTDSLQIKLRRNLLDLEQHINPVARQQEARHAGHVVDPNGHRPAVAFEHRRQGRASAETRDLTLQERLVDLDPTQRHAGPLAVQHLANALERALGNAQLGPADFREMLVFDLVAEVQACSGNDDFDGAGVRLFRRDIALDLPLDPVAGGKDGQPPEHESN